VPRREGHSRRLVCEELLQLGLELHEVASKAVCKGFETLSYSRQLVAVSESEESVASVCILHGSSRLV